LPWGESESAERGKGDKKEKSMQGGRSPKGGNPEGGKKARFFNDLAMDAEKEGEIVLRGRGGKKRRLCRGEQGDQLGDTSVGSGSSGKTREN